MARVLFVVLSFCIAEVSLADQTIDQATGDSTREMTNGVSGYSSITLDYQQMIELPVRTLDEILFIQNGVVDVPQDGSVVNELHIRAGREYGHRFYLNGISFNNPISGQLSATISPRMMGSLSYFPGGPSVSYGDSEAGSFEIFSRRGGRKYSGSVEVISDNVGGSGFDQNWYSAGISGPIPGLDKGSFFGFIERRWLGDRSPSPLTLDVLPDSPDRLPANWQEGWSYHGRADYSFTDKIAMTATADYIEDGWSEYRHEFLFNLDHTPRYRNNNLGLSAKLRHDINPALSYSLGASYFKSERMTGDGLLFDNLDAYRRNFANFDFYDIAYFIENEYPMPGSYVDPDVEPGSPGDTVILVPSYYDYFRHDKSTRMGLTASVAKKINDRNTICAGVDFKRYTIRSFENNNPTSVFGYVVRAVNRYGFSSNGEESDDVEYFHETKHPTEFSLYIEDCLKLEGVSIDGGLRYVRYDYNSLQFKDLLSPLDPGNVTGVDTLDPGDLEPTSAFDYILPGFGISADIGDKFKLRLNYGKHVQRPPFQYIYAGYDYIASHLIIPSSFRIFPFVSLEPERTTQYAVGGTWGICDNIVLDAAVFYRNMDYQVKIYHVANASPFTYDIYDNEISFPSVAKGIELRLAASPTKKIDLNLNYAFSWSEGVRSYPESDYNIIWQNPLVPVTQDMPLDYDRTHDMAATIVIYSEKGDGPRLGGIYPFERTTFSCVFHAYSGRPYTPYFVYDEALEIPVSREPKAEINSENRPEIISIDIRMEREFTIGEIHISPFVWVKNLLDRQNIADVWVGSGEPNTTNWLDSDEGIRISNEFPEVAPLHQLKENDPTHYAPPRQVYFGMRVSF